MKRSHFTGGFTIEAREGGYMLARAGMEIVLCDSENDARELIPDQTELKTVAETIAA